MIRGAIISAVPTIPQIRVYKMRVREAKTFPEIGDELGFSTEWACKLNSQLETLLCNLKLYFGVTPTIEQLEQMAYAYSKPSPRTIQRRRRIRRERMAV